MIGVPGLAKTKLVETLGTVLGLNARFLFKNSEERFPAICFAIK